MVVTKEKVIENVTEEFNEVLRSINAEDYRLKEKVIDVDLKEQTITIKFNFNINEMDDYLGLSFY